MRFFRIRPTLLAAAFVFLVLADPAFGQKDKAAPDVLVFANGDQLSGKFVRAVGGNVTFKSDMAGEITVGLDKVKELRASTDFVALRKGSGKLPVAAVGAVTVRAGDVVITHGDAVSETIPGKELGFLIDRSTYDREVARQPGFFRAWNGSVTGGASLVRSTQTATTLTAGAALVRTSPSVPYLPARNRTTLNLTETYGKQSSPVIPPATPPAPDNAVLTSIFHADSERDEYLRSNFYVLADVSFDHNYAQGLQLQQIYGAGAGYTALKTGRQQLDFKADGHFQRQMYFSVSPGITAAPAVNVFGSTFAESYLRNLPHKVVFTETANYEPGWTELRAYSVNAVGTLTMPVFKRLSAAVTATDNYLNDPAPYYRKNSFQFTTGITYTLR